LLKWQSFLIQIDVWLITDGYDTGIVNIVGLAIKKAKLMSPGKKFTALAICQWGMVDNVKGITNGNINKLKVELNTSYLTSDEAILSVFRSRGVNKKLKCLPKGKKRTSRKMKHSILK
jgi:hypothetical protein